MVVLMPCYIPREGEREKERMRQTVASSLNRIDLPQGCLVSLLSRTKAIFSEAISS